MTRKSTEGLFLYGLVDEMGSNNITESIVQMSDTDLLALRDILLNCKTHMEKGLPDCAAPECYRNYRF